MMVPRFGARSRRVRTNGIRMQVHEDGPEDGLPIVFCHGFPELAYSWRHQLKGLGRLGYRTLAPDLRGYGETDRPPDLEGYRLANLCRDVTGLLDDLGLEKAVFVGHDMGGLLVYALAVAFRERCHGVVSLNTPYRRRPSENPVELVCRLQGGARYDVTFQKTPLGPGDTRPGIAENLLSADVKKTFRSLLLTSRRSYEQLREAFPEALELLPIGIFVGDPVLGELPLVSEEELMVYVRTYEQTGFTGGLSWYRNVVCNWKASAVPGGEPGATHPIHVPVLMVTASRDPVIRPEMARDMDDLVPDLEVRALECGHWTQQEKPEEVNALIHDWIGRRLRLDPGGGGGGRTANDDDAV